VQAKVEQKGFDFSRCTQGTPLAAAHTGKLAASIILQPACAAIREHERSIFLFERPEIVDYLNGRNPNDRFVISERHVDAALIDDTLCERRGGRLIRKKPTIATRIVASFTSVIVIPISSGEVLSSLSVSLSIFAPDKSFPSQFSGGLDVLGRSSS